MTGWGPEQLTREDLLNLGRKLHSAWDASVRQANRSTSASQTREFFAVGAEMCWLWGEAADELIARESGGYRLREAPGAAAAREPEAGS